MSELLSSRAMAALRAIREGRFLMADGWCEIGRMENVGARTLEELSKLPELEWRDGSHWREVRLRSMSDVGRGDDRVVVLLAEILAVLRDRL